jgi:4-hydroxy-tetrahydrodipicolinate reductase
MTRIVQIGLGPVGLRTLACALERPENKLVAAVDSDPDKIGRDVGRLLGRAKLGVTVAPQLPAAARRAKVALVTTVSSLEACAPTLIACAQAGLHVVTTCEELAFPWVTQPGPARRLDRAFRASGTACLGTGVNPGFLMDYLPVVLSSVCRKVEKITVRRTQNASPRRIPFQQKIGVGLAPAMFRKRAREGSLRHVGLSESVHGIAHALGWRLDTVREILKPVIADEPTAAGYQPVLAGQARGVEQIARGMVGGRERIRLHFRAAIAEPDPEDSVEIVGDPGFLSRIPGGIHGDTATAAIAANAISAVLRAEPGLRTMFDTPVPAGRGVQGMVGRG